MLDTSYPLGTQAEELERLRLQHQLWAPTASAAWARAGLQKGERVLDLGAGPGFAAMDLARVVGPSGRVLGLERSETYVETGEAFARNEGLHQLELRQLDLLKGPWPSERFDLIWCRWVAMFLPRLEPLLQGFESCLHSGGRLVIHEYVHWDTFALHPHGDAIRRFVEACQRSFQQAGGDQDVNRRLPALLADRGWRIEALQPIPVAGGPGSMAERWLMRFVDVYGQRLQTLGLWSANDRLEAEQEIQRTRTMDGSFWVGPTLLEVRARRVETAAPGPEASD
jgi:SAM-dependent methyltransferase